MNPLEILVMTLAGVWQGLRQDWNLFEIFLVILLVWGIRTRGWRFPWRFPTIRIGVLGASISMAALAIGLRIALLPLSPIPEPVITDEFSHLLLADTLREGRASNPTHPYWRHFESLHIIQQPSYASSYFPGPAAFMAAAWVVLGHPWFGVLASSGIFCGLLCWALAGWIPRRWAIFGSLVAIVRFSTASYWIDAYHGGFPAAIGGTLILGAYPRIRRKPAFANGFLLGLGFAVLLFTRPYEGALFAVPFVVAILRDRKFASWRAFAPAGVAGIAALVLLGSYLKNVTGSATVTPYQISQKAYGWPMALAWVTPTAVKHNHIELERYYNYELAEREKVEPLHFVTYLTFRAQEYWRFFFGPALSIVFLVLPVIFRRKRLIVVAAGAALGAAALEGAASPHYVAPASAALVAIVVEGVRILRRECTALPVLILAIMAAILTMKTAAKVTGLPYTQELNFQSWCCEVQGNPNKARISRWLETQQGRHLIFVDAKTDEYNLFQWIYNPASIDNARMVWARDLGTEANEKLRAYYSDRRVWVVNPNVEPAEIRPAGPALSLK